MFRPNRPTVSATAVLALSLALAACKSTVVPAASEIGVPQSFDHAAAQEDTDTARWWQSWGDPVLDRLVAQALAQNFDIRAARSRLNEARAQAELARADLMPSVGAQLGGRGVLGGEADNPLNDTARTVLARIPAASALSQKEFDLSGYSLSAALSASWEPDIFGRKTADADAARHAALGVQEQVYGARLLAAAETADNYLQARAAQARLAVLQDNIRTLERLLRYTRGRFAAGHTAADSVDAVKSRLSAARSAEGSLKAAYGSAVRNIAVLTGQVPQGFRLPESPRDLLAEPPAAPAGATPQGMIERRPDLRARAAAVRARAAQVAGAKADLLPRFTIGFLTQGMRIGGDTVLAGWASLLSAGIQVPLFTGGRIRANIKAADARLKTALLEYDRNLLAALGETDSAYQLHTALARQSTLLAQSQKEAAKHAADSRRLFELGSKTLDAALTAQTDAAQARDRLIQSRLAQTQTLIALYKALGGGWQPENGQSEAE